MPLSLAHLCLWAGYRRMIGAATVPFVEDLTRLSVNFLVLDYITFLAIAGTLQVRGLLGGIRARERERARLALRNASLQARLAEARLQALASQLRPHFLFNALNAVSELVHQDPAEAERMIARLGDLLRLVLARTERHEVSLAEELEIVDAYLAIERSRFRGRLETSIDVDRSAWDVRVPTLSVQPLVENAVRHGVERDGGAGMVLLRARVENGTLSVSVTDDGRGSATPSELPRSGVTSPSPEEADRSGGRRPEQREPRAEREGIGLANTRSRLTELYGERASLELSALPEGGTRAVLRVPVGAPP